MAKRTKRTRSSKPQSEGVKKAQETFSDISGEVSEWRAPSSSAEKQLFSGIFGGVPEFREPPSFPVWFSAQLARWLLCVICVLVLIFFFAWLFTRPSPTEVQELLGSSADSKDLLETLSNLRRDHFDQFRNLFQLIVLSVLVPLFTLLAGYAFGTRQRTRQREVRE